MASSAKSGMVDSICLAKQADLEAVAFSGTGRRLARAAIGLGFAVFRGSTGFATFECAHWLQRSKGLGRVHKGVHGRSN